MALPIVEGWNRLGNMFILEDMVVGHRHVGMLIARMEIEAIYAMRRGFVYLVVIVDWATRKVLAHRVPIAMTTDFCVEALNKAIAQYGTPEIFNTGQESQFASMEFTQVLKDNHIRISMDGKSRRVDNVFVERLWKSVKYEHVYLHAYETIAETRVKLGDYLAFFNSRRPHSSLDRQTPDMVYFKTQPQVQAA